MYLYNIGYGSFEDSSYAILQSEFKFTDEELHGLVLNAIIKILEDIVETDNVDHRVFLMEDGIGYDSLQDLVIDHLVQYNGFEEVVYQARWSVFGWPSITNDKSWKRQRDKISDRLFKEIPDDLKAKVNALATKKRGMIILWKS